MLVPSHTAVSHHSHPVLILPLSLADSFLADPCIGYVFHEPSYPMRKVVILGDTHDPSLITPLCISPSPSLLIHEATDAYIPQDIDSRAKRSVEVVKEKALARGHSTPDMAGAFAKSIGAEMLVLNHIGARFVFQ